MIVQTSQTENKSVIFPYILKSQVNLPVSTKRPSSIARAIPYVRTMNKIEFFARDSGIDASLNQSQCQAGDKATSCLLIQAKDTL